MTGIFISYRREDSGPYAGRLYDALVSHFGQEGVFFDIDAIGPGEDFREVIQKTCSSCKVLLAVIGRQWATVCDKNGKIRLESKNDTLRMEIASALQNGLRVIPVLVGGAEMPDESALPEDLQALAYRNAWDLSDKRFHSDVELLVEALKKTLNNSPQNISINAPGGVGSETPEKTPRRVQKKSGAAALTRKTAPSTSGRSSSSPHKSARSLVPLYGISPGKTTESELANVAKRTTVIDDETGEPYRNWELNGVTFCGDKSLVKHLVLFVKGLIQQERENRMPVSWQKLGLRWENSYDEWLSSLRDLGYEITVEEKPHVEQSDGHGSFSALVSGRKQDPYPHQISVRFSFSRGTTKSAAGTACSLWIEAVS